MMEMFEKRFEDKFFEDLLEAARERLQGLQVKVTEKNEVIIECQELPGLIVRIEAQKYWEEYVAGLEMDEVIAKFMEEAEKGLTGLVEMAILLGMWKDDELYEQAEELVHTIVNLWRLEEMTQIDGTWEARDAKIREKAQKVLDLCEPFEYEQLERTKVAARCITRLQKKGKRLQDTELINLINWVVEG